MKQIFSILLVFSSLTAFSQVGLTANNHVEETIIASFTEGVSAIDLQQVEIALPENTPVPLVYSYKKLAFFCKVDVQLENVVKFPVKFRLGSVEYVDYLEGK